MVSAVKSPKDSAQSPAWRRKARPRATSASEAVSRRASLATTRGGRVARRASTLFRASASGQTGCWRAVRWRQDPGCHPAGPSPPARARLRRVGLGCGLRHGTSVWPGRTGDDTRVRHRLGHRAPVPLRRPGVQRPQRAGLARPGPQGRGARVLHPLRARPPRRPMGPHGGPDRRRRGHHHLRVGTLVLDNDFRHPLMVAKEAATLDLLSEGRLELGMGAGWQRTDYEHVGHRHGPALGAHRTAGREPRHHAGAVDLGPCDLDGPSLLASTNAVGSPRPHRPGGPQLVIGGGGRRILTLAGERADIVSVIPSLAAGQIGPEVAASALRGAVPRAGGVGAPGCRGPAPTRSNCSAGPWPCRSCPTPPRSWP